MVANELLLVLEVGAIVAILVALDIQGFVAKGAALAVMVNVVAGDVLTPHKYELPEEDVKIGFALALKV